MRTCLFFIAVALSLSCYSQSKLDSLESAFLQARLDSTKIKILHQLFDAYRYETPLKAKGIIEQAIKMADQAKLDRLKINGINKLADFFSRRGNYDSAVVAFEEALHLSEKIQYHTGKSEALILLGNTYWRKGNLPKAKEYQELNLAFSEKIKDEDGIASSNNNLGNIYNELGEYTKAMEHYTKASIKYASLGNVRNTGITYANIAIIHSQLENYPKAITYYKKSDSIFNQLDFLIGNAFIAKNLAILYKDQGDINQSMQYSEQALEIYQQTGQLKEMGQTTQTVGNLFWEQGNFQKAKGYFLKAHAIHTQIGDSIGIARTSKALSTNYLDLGELDSAIFYSQKALNIATNLGIMLTAMDAYETLAEIYRVQNDLNEAYSSLSNYILLKDSLYTIEKRDLATEIEAKYQNEAQQKTIELQELQIAKRQNERNGLIILSLIALAVIGLLINQYRIKQAANKRLKEMDRIKSVFFQNLSHEFRTPLSLILAPIKDRMSKPSSDEDEQLFNTIVRSAENLDELIKQLLDLAKLEEGKLMLSPKPLEASTFFRVLAASYESMAAVKDIDFEVRIPDEVQWLELDEKLIRKICHNLLSNAFKFTPAGKNISFEIIYDDFLRIHVTDNGPGIPKKDQQHIFDRFYQVEGPHASGTGIGLALTKALVETTKGKIKLESEPKKGSSFEVSIPTKKIDPERLEIQPSTPIVSDPQGKEDPVLSEKEQTLLIIEDNEDLRSYLSDTFADNFNIHLAKDGQEGIDTAKEIIPDLIISDIMMDEMDGLEVCKTLKSNIETDHIPIILLTARSDQETKLTGIQQGADAYLLKPFESQELKVTVNNLIHQREKLRAHYLNEIDDRKGTGKAESHPFLKKCETLIQEHLSEDAFTADDFAKEIGMSRMQVHRKLKAMTDLSTTAFIRRYRLVIAKALLEKGEPVSQVAYAVGFSSLSYFTKSFKEQFEVTPSQIAKKTDQTT